MGSASARFAASSETNPSSAIACSTTFRRSRERSADANGDQVYGDWITPAMVAASARLMLLTSLPKKSRALWWDKQPQEIAERVRMDKSRLAQPSYVYGNDQGG